MDIAHEIRFARHRAGLTQAELAQLSGTSQATLSAYESGGKTPSATTLARLFSACGRRLTTAPATRPVSSPGSRTLAERGRTLAAVLDLAGRLPTKHARTLQFPPLRPAAEGS